MSDGTQISTPVAKAATALGAGAGTSALSLSQDAASFLPHDLAGWLACAASGLAVLYSAHLLSEWYWKKVWRPLLERRGWIAPKPVPHTRRWNDPAEETE